MALDNLREFIQAIDRIGELVRVTQPVRARLEIAEIADRCMKSPGGGPALLFEHVMLDDGTRSPQSGRHQPVRLDAADVPGARRGRPRRHRRRASPRCST